MDNKEIILEQLKIAKEIVNNTRPDINNYFVGYSGECKYIIYLGVSFVEINIYIKNRYLPIYTKHIACINRGFANLHGAGEEYNRFYFAYEDRLATWRHDMGMKNLKILHEKEYDNV